MTSALTSAPRNQSARPLARGTSSGNSRTAGDNVPSSRRDRSRAAAFSLVNCYNFTELSSRP